MIFLKKGAKIAHKKLYKFRYVIFFLLFLVFTSCDGDSSIRSYTEEAPAQEMRASVENRIKWEKPAGWTQETNTSGMRLATFSTGAGDDAIICTIVPLKGEAGGLKANVTRWLGQLKIQMQSEEKLERFLDQKESFFTRGNYSADLVDFTALAAKPDDISMMVAIVRIAEMTLFIKMSGKKEPLVANRPGFESLCKSIHVGTKP